MNKTILMEVENLRRASLATLREKYRELFQQETQCRHHEHLFRRIAWRLQARAEGDLTERARNRASEIANDADLGILAPRDFFTVGGARVEITGTRWKGFAFLALRRCCPQPVEDFDVLVRSTRAMNVVSGKDAMRDRAYTFTRSPEQLRLFGARGGRAYGRNQRARRAFSVPPPKAIVPHTRYVASTAESIAVLDAHFPWLLGAEKRLA